MHRLFYIFAFRKKNIAYTVHLFKVAAGCEKLKESADEFNKIERVGNHKEDEMSMTLVEVNNSQTQVSHDSMFIVHI